ncbi:hypothetical protein V8C44DRAFT_360896 [Trichoderma aethiopicum]
MSHEITFQSFSCGDRHVELKHNNPGTTWICLDPGNEATVGDHKILKPFRKCKRCTGLKEFKVSRSKTPLTIFGVATSSRSGIQGFRTKTEYIPGNCRRKGSSTGSRWSGQRRQQAPVIAPPPAPQAPIIAPPAAQNPAATPESTVSSSDQGSDATGSVASGDDTVSPPDAERPMFEEATVMFLLENHCVIGQEPTIDPASLTNNQ